jgi:hypothetical protein
VTHCTVHETVPVTGEVARFPAETLGTHKDGKDGNCTVHVTQQTRQTNSVPLRHLQSRAFLKSLRLLPPPTAAAQAITSTASPHQGCRAKPDKLCTATQTYLTEEGAAGVSVLPSLCLHGTQHSSKHPAQHSCKAQLPLGLRSQLSQHSLHAAHTAHIWLA